MVFTTIAMGAASLQPLIMFAVIIAIMYFMMIRPQRKRQKEIENFRRGLQVGRSEEHTSELQSR